MAPAQRETFAFLPGLHLEVHGDKRTQAHFRAEYRAARVDPGAEADLIVSFSRTSSRSPGFEAGYRSLRWRVALDPLGDGPLRATIDLRGAPRSFGLSLLQGYVVEPLLGLLGHAHPDIRRTAAAALGAIGAVEAAGALAALGADTDIEVRKAASHALDQIALAGRPLS